MKNTLIPADTGQDGAYLAEFLLGKNHEGHGTKRRTSMFNTGYIDHLGEVHEDNIRKLILHQADFTNSSSLISIEKEKLGWTLKISFAEQVTGMVREELKAPERNESVKSCGHNKAMD